MTCPNCGSIRVYLSTESSISIRITGTTSLTKRYWCVDCGCHFKK